MSPRLNFNGSEVPQNTDSSPITRDTHAIVPLSCNLEDFHTALLTLGLRFWHKLVGGLTAELTDAGGQWCPNWQLARPARVRSSELVRRLCCHPRRVVA